MTTFKAKIGSIEAEVALCWGALAELEKEFGVESFDQVRGVLARVESRKGDDGKDESFIIPNTTAVLKFWKIVFKWNDVAADDLERQVVNPYDAVIQAAMALESVFDTQAAA